MRTGPNGRRSIPDNGVFTMRGAVEDAPRLLNGRHVNRRDLPIRLAGWPGGPGR